MPNKSDLHDQVRTRTDLIWTKSEFSNPHNCVEVAQLNGGMALRDSMDPAGPALVFTEGEFLAFAKGVRSGQFA